MKKLLAMLLACVMAAGLWACALAAGTVVTTGSVNLRTGPGLDYEKVTAVEIDTELEYLGETSTDDRGVDWYLVSYEGESLWISSRYSELTEAANAEGQVELSDYYQCDLAETAEALNLTLSTLNEPSELQNHYINEAIEVAGNGAVDMIEITGEGYSLFGVSVGMSADDARACFAAAGLAPSEGQENVFQHPAGSNAPVSVKGFDSCLSFVLDADGRVCEINWSTYTG